jgi:hypothetical protein
MAAVKQVPKLKRGERYCNVCGRVVRVGFADNGAHSQSAEHIRNYELKFGRPTPAEK